jgi:hypothetical protein
MRLGQNACLGNCLDEFDKSGERSRAIMALLFLFLFFLKNVGTFIVTLQGANKSCTLNHLSAIMESPGSHMVNKELRSTICLSLVDPP